MKIYTSLFVFCFSLSTLCQNKVGLIENKVESTPGYILFAPLHSKTTYLIDKCGYQVHSWTSNYCPGQSVYLLPKGELLRTANDSNKVFKGGGTLEKFSWDNKLLWSYSISNDKECQHHDICPLPNGNILVLVWERKTKQEALESGRDSKLVGESIWSEKIIELQPKGKNQAKIVWEWHVWDHLVQDLDSTRKNFGTVSDNKQLFDINYLASLEADWLHFNSLAYNEERDEIMISNRNFNEIYIIDHSTTSKEAAGHTGGKRNLGGDLLFRFGNPAAHKKGTVSDQKLFGQHHAHWIEKGFKDEGKIIVFNNGQGRRSNLHSSIDIITPILDSLSNYIFPEFSSYKQVYSEKIKEEAGASFFSPNVSSVQRLKNGHTIVCSGASGRFCELNSNQQTVWVYVNPVQRDGIAKAGMPPGQNQVFRCTFYELDYIVFKKKKIQIGKPIETNSVAYPCDSPNKN